MNGVGFSLKSLADTGANGYLFIKNEVARKASEIFGTPILSLPYSVQVSGFQGTNCSRVSKYIRLHLTIQGRRIYNCPFLLVDLGNQDLIIGKKLMHHFKLHLDIRKERFVWPSEYPPTPIFQREIIVPLESSSPGSLKRLSHQGDMERRENKRRKIEKRSLDGANSRGILKLNMLSGSLKFQSETEPQEVPKEARVGSDPIPSSPKSRKPRKRARRHYQEPEPSQPEPLPPRTLDICQIGAQAFHFNTRKPKVEVYYTSIYELDRVIEEREAEDAETNALLDKHLLPEYEPFRDVFSKVLANELPPHRSYDHKIQLTEPLPRHYSPLYKQSTEELKATKDYLIDNLSKGWIEASQSPFASPVLFVRKASGALRFCVDYRKLNSITRVDAYPLPRIDELLSRVSKAKIFTKLDIRAAFNRLRIHPDSEEYTTFRTKYGSYKSKVLPFGLTNGPATYQRYMNDVLMEYLDDFAMAFLDDILIYSSDLKTHRLHVAQVLTRLREAGLQVDIAKTKFYV